MTLFVQQNVLLKWHRTITTTTTTTTKIARGFGEKSTVTVFGVLHETLISRTIGDCSFLVDCRSIFFCLYRRSRCRCLLCCWLVSGNNETKTKVIESRARTANKFNSWKPFRFSFRRCLSHTNNLFWCLALHCHCSALDESEPSTILQQKNTSKTV